MTAPRNSLKRDYCHKIIKYFVIFITKNARNTTVNDQIFEIYREP